MQKGINRNKYKLIFTIILSILSIQIAAASLIIPKSTAEQIIARGYEPSDKGFFKAAKDGNVQVLGFFLESNIYVNMKDSTGKTPSYIAAAAGMPKAVRFLLLCGADINTRDENLKSPLMAAIESKSYETVKILIDSNAKLNICDENGYTPLHYAVINNQPEIVRLITSNYCDIDAQDNEGNTPLYYSVGNPEIAEILINVGADINGINMDGKTVLHEAVIKNKIEIVKLLTEKGINVNIEDIKGHPAVYYTTEDNPIYLMLVESGAKP